MQDTIRQRLAPALDFFFDQNQKRKIDNLIGYRSPPVKKNRQITTKRTRFDVDNKQLMMPTHTDDLLKKGKKKKNQSAICLKIVEGEMPGMSFERPAGGAGWFAR